MNPDITENIKELALPLAEEKGLFLVDVELKTGGGTELWVYLDGEDRGVNLDECVEISRELGFLIDAHDFFDGKYRLNVSSPGLSRPLTDLRQYQKNIGRTIRVKFKTEENENTKVQGELTGASEATLLIADENGETKVPFHSIIEAKIIPVI